MRWNWNRIVKQMDDLEEGKVDKSEVQQLRDDMRERWQNQDKMHSENRRRLDAILSGIAGLKNGIYTRDQE